MTTIFDDTWRLSYSIWHFDGNPVLFASPYTECTVHTGGVQMWLVAYVWKAENIVELKTHDRNVKTQLHMSKSADSDDNMCRKSWLKSD